MCALNPELGVNKGALVHRSDLQRRTPDLRRAFPKIKKRLEESALPRNRKSHASRR